MDYADRQRLLGGTNRALWRFVRVLLRAQVGALVLGVAAGLLTLLWASSAPDESELTDVAAVALPDQSVGAISAVPWTKDRWELAPLRAELSAPEESDDGDSVPLVDASDRLREDGWDITGFANGDDGQYVEATRDDRTVQVYDDAVVLLRAVPEGTGLAEQIGLALGALIGGMAALRVRGPARPARSGAGAARLVAACALLLPTGFAIHAGLTGQPIAGWLGVRLLTLAWIVGLVVVLILAAIATVAVVSANAGRRQQVDPPDGYDGGSSRGPTPRTGPDPW